MASLQSGLKPTARHSRRSLSASPRSSVISPGLVLCSTSQPFLNHSCKLTVVSRQEDLGALENGRQEMVLAPGLGAEFVGRIDRWIDLASHGLLGGLKGGHDLAEGDAGREIMDEVDP